MTIIEVTFSIRVDGPRQKRWAHGTYSQSCGVQFNGVSTSRTWTGSDEFDPSTRKWYKQQLQDAVRPLIAGMRQRDNVGNALA